MHAVVRKRFWLGVAFLAGAGAAAPSFATVICNPPLARLQRAEPPELGREIARRIVGADESVPKHKRVERAWKNVVSMRVHGDPVDVARQRAIRLECLLRAIPDFRFVKREPTPDGSLVFEAPGRSSSTDSEVQFFAIRATNGALYRGSRDPLVPSDWNPEYEYATELRP